MGKDNNNWTWEPVMGTKHHWHVTINWRYPWHWSKCMDGNRMLLLVPLIDYLKFVHVSAPYISQDRQHAWFMIFVFKHCGMSEENTHNRTVWWEQQTELPNWCPAQLDPRARCFFVDVVCLQLKSPPQVDISRYLLIIVGQSSWCALSGGFRSGTT